MMRVDDRSPTTDDIGFSLLHIFATFVILHSQAQAVNVHGSSLADGLFCRGGHLWQFGSDSPSISSPTTDTTAPTTSASSTATSTPSGTSPPPSMRWSALSAPSARSSASRPTPAFPRGSRCSRARLRLQHRRGALRPEPRGARPGHLRVPRHPLPRLRPAHPVALASTRRAPRRSSRTTACPPPASSWSRSPADARRAAPLPALREAGVRGLGQGRERARSICQNRAQLREQVSKLLATYGSRC